MSVKLTDLKVVGCPDPSAHNNDSCYKPVTAAEVASACPTEVLIGVLVERGVVIEWTENRVGVGLVRCRSFIKNYEPVVGGVS